MLYWSTNLFIATVFIFLSNIYTWGLCFVAAFLDETEKKYMFECDYEEQCGEWIDAIIKAR